MKLESLEDKEQIPVLLNIILLNMKEEITLNNKRIILVGTAHISQDSIEEVEQVIREEKPDTVCVELCQSRYESIRNTSTWKSMDIVKVVKQGKASLLMANLVMSAFQKKMGDKIGVKPGAEMVAAMNVAEEVGATTVLADREVSVTLKRTWGNLSFWEKIKLFNQVLMSLFESSDISEEDVEELKQKDVLNDAIQSLGEAMPSLKSTLIDERDQFLATKIAEAEGETIVAVVGAGHLPGILRQIETPSDLTKISELPKPGRMGKILKWGIPLLITALVVYGFTLKDMAVGYEMIKLWVIVNGVLAALGAVIAGGHIITILVAFIAAPITSLNPTIAAGWVSGLTEAWVRKPKVEDFENLPNDITSVRGFRKNEITKILLVVVLSNLGSSIGSFVGIPLIAGML